MNIYYNDDYIGSEYAFDTTRKSQHVAALISEQPERFTIVSPENFYKDTEVSIRSTHDIRYVDAVLTGEPSFLASSQGFDWDPGIYKMALAHNAGVVAALTEACEGRNAGSLSSGLHHAKYGAGAGFCTFNGLAVAVNHILSTYDKRILILDFDAHCGGGTYSLLNGKCTHVDVSTSGYDHYEVKSNDSESVLVLTDPNKSYVSTVREVLESLKDKDFDVCLYNAGMDPYNTGISQEELVARESLVSYFLYEKNIPTAFVLAGGYTWGSATMDKIASLHFATADAFEEFFVGDTVSNGSDIGS